MNIPLMVKVLKINFLWPWNDKIESKKKQRILQYFSYLLRGPMTYSRVLGFLRVLSLTWLAYATLHYSFSCYLPVTSLCCCFSRTQRFPTVKLLNNGGITKWPTGRCQSSMGFLNIGENGRPLADVYYCLIRQRPLLLCLRGWYA